MSAALLVGPTQQTQASDHTTAKIQAVETSTGGQAEDGDKAIEKKEKAGAAAPENDQVAEKVP